MCLVTGSNRAGAAQRRKYVMVEVTLKGHSKGTIEFSIPNGK